MGGKPRKKMTASVALDRLAEALDAANAQVTLNGKPLHKKRSSVVHAYDELGKAITKLDPAHSIVGRRTSRALVIRRLKRLRELLDHDFPTIPKKRKAPRKPRSPTTKANDFARLMKRRRYVRFNPQIGAARTIEMIALTTATGARHYQCPVTGLLFWPRWLSIMAAKRESQAAMSRMQKDRKGQLALEAAWRLEAGPADAAATTF